MKKRHLRFCVTAFAVFASAFCTASAAHTVRTGTIAEGRHGVSTAETMTAEGCGDLLNLFYGEWTPESLRAVGEHCRRHGCTFTMDEPFDRLSGEWKSGYASVTNDILAALREYRDVCGGTQLYSETGGVMFYWPMYDAKTRSPRIPDAGNSLSNAHFETCALIRKDLKQAVAAGLPSPIFSIECSFGFAPYLLRAGYDRVDLEVIYSPEIERAFAGVKTASEAFGRPAFGADMAMVWYGGTQSDRLWEARWRTSLYHAYIRGADPIYNEHGLMGIDPHGRNYGKDHPVSRRYRKVLSEFAAWCRENPRADGYPLAAVAAVQGRFDGYAGVFQTHLFGQRDNEAFRVADADRAWTLFDGLYRRREWQDPERWGDVDRSGNPPLGMAGILPFDAPEEEFGKYRFLFFVGRNVMDDVLYAKLVEYVRKGGTLLLSASHLNVQDAPDGEYRPYNDGDWSRLAGVRMRPDGVWRVPHGIKFAGNPCKGWNFQPHDGICDPAFIDGGFEALGVETTTATPVAYASDRFVESPAKDSRYVIFANKIGSGNVIFLASTDSPGAQGVRRLYSFLMSKGVEAVAECVWPKVECSDAVRWNVYPDGTVYLLNTEVNLPQEAIVEFAQGAPRTVVRVEPGEIKTLRCPAAGPSCRRKKGSDEKL